MQPTKETCGEFDADRRDFLAKAGKFAATVPPAMTILMSTSMSSTAIAQSASSKGNNGVGNGVDPPPPGNPPWNDPPGSGPGDPNNKGGPPHDYDPG